MYRKLLKSVHFSPTWCLYSTKMCFFVTNISTVFDICLTMFAQIYAEHRGYSLHKQKSGFSLKHGGILKHEFVANLLPESASEKIFENWIIVKLWPRVWCRFFDSRCSSINTVIRLVNCQLA